MTTTLIGQHRPSVWKYEPRSVEGKRIVVTGGTTGSGRSTALLLASLGARVLIFGRHRHLLDEAMRDLEEVRDNVIGLNADVSNERDIDVVYAAVDEQLGGLDILVNNAGVPGGTVTEEDPEQYRKIVEINLLGYMSMAKRAVPRMRKAGGGHIVNIGSLSAKEKGAQSDVYSATKAGLRGFVEALSKQVQEDNIHVTLIEPGKFGADFRVQSKQDQEKEEREGQLLFSECIAEAVLFQLTTPQNCMIPYLAIQPLHQEIGN